MVWRRTAAAVVAMLALVACGNGAEDSAGSTEGAAGETAAAADTSEAQASSPAAASPSAPSPSDAASAATVAVTTSDFGDILVDAEGRTLYVFDNDTSTTSSCYDDCAANWPALTGEAEAGEGADAGLLGTSEREDGTVQVTYADHPLYYFAGDGGPGETNGQGVGGVWWVVAPDGTAITEETARAGGY